jgi:acyl-CoA reductase-like NAD-dependent aldehyde dehydrogenase
VDNEIAARKSELADLLAREEGKALSDAGGEVVHAGQIFKFFAGEALSVFGELLASTRPGLTIEITREPVGVMVVITPWSFPDGDPRVEDCAGAGRWQRPVAVRHLAASLQRP